MAVAVDAAASSGYFSASSTVSWSHTVGSGSDRVLVVSTGFWNSSGSVSNVTYGGVSLTRVVQSTLAAAGDRCEIWRLINPTSGTATVQITFSAAAYGNAGSVSTTGTDQTTPCSGSVSGTGSSTTPSVSPTGGTTGDLAVDALAWSTTGSNQTATMASQSGRTQRFNASGGANDEGGAGSTQTDPANPETMNWTMSASATWAMASTVVKQVAASGNTGTIAANLTALSMSASGTETFSGTIAANLTALSMSATGSSPAFEGTIAANLTPLSMAASGTETFTGTVAANLTPLSMAASGTEQFIGTIAANLIGLAVAATGTVGDSFNGTVAANLTPLTMAASGTEQFIGTAADTLPGLTMSASGTNLMPITGTIVANMPALGVALVGSILIVGTPANSTLHTVPAVVSSSASRTRTKSRASVRRRITSTQGVQ